MLDQRTSSDIKTMAAAMVEEAGGFSFDLCRRNASLDKLGIRPPNVRKTGTTIVGVVYKVSFVPSDETIFKGLANP